MQRLEHDCRVVGERWDEPDVGRTPELDAAGPAFAREVDDLTELADVVPCERTGRADKLDAGLHDLAVARGHRGLLTEYRSEVREAERTGGFAVALGDEPRYGGREVRTQGDERAVGV